MTGSAWRQTQLGQEFQLLYGKSLPASARIAGDVPVFGSNGIVGFHNKPLVDAPGIIVGRKGSVGEVAFSDRPFWPIDTTYYVSDRGENNWRFLYFLLQHLQLTGLNSHSTVPGLNRESVYSIESAFPPKSEQEKIAAVLWKIQKAVEIEDAIVRNARAVKKSLLHRLFTHGLRDEPVKETEIGPLPESWLEKPLGELVEIEYEAQAAVASALSPSIGIPILTNINISNEGRLDFSTLRYYSVPPKKRERLILRKGDVLFNWRSGSKSHIGKTAIFSADGEYTYSSFILRFRTKGEIISEYLCYYFYFIKSEGFFTERGNVSSINNVYNASLAATIPVAYPPLGEQREIADILQTVDRKIDIHESKKRSLQDLFKTTLHKLMTAQIRVNDLDIDTSEVGMGT